jgi:hypothetical protein
MIHEFAIEPEVMATWPHFHALWDDFGVGKGRLIAEYPKAWRREVHERVQRNAANHLIPPVRATAISSRISFERHKFIGARGRPYEPKNLWRENAEAQQASALPFKAIVAQENPSNRVDVLIPGEFDRGAEPWKVRTQHKIPRVPASLADCARLLLAAADELILVDPNFNPSEPRFTQPLAAFVARRQWRRLELHVACPASFNAGPQNGNFNHYVAPLIPSGSKLTIFFWNRKPAGEKLHARFLLTELGGIQFDYGLDEGDSGGDTTIVNLLEHDLFIQLRQDYAVNSTTFALQQNGILSVNGQG